MESITTQTSLLSHHNSASVAGPPTVGTPPEEMTTIPAKSKQLQPDQVALSEEAKAKSAAAETKEKDEEKNSIDASSLSNAMTAEEAASAEKAQESDLDKQIRELSMEILELSVKIQMLQDKEDKESVKERQSLEVDLAIKKGQLEAAMDRKLQLAAVGG
ncbi:hypothetical protein [Colwellia sp. 75C3]|uniref:hypothetical protein n=1 Tax=Colwellia sp. 75C3 TaxID=888425 RepID=UPI001E617F6D|nr:hypothetical protein [Colwellia sp. 75C3]